MRYVQRIAVGTYEDQREAHQEYLDLFDTIASDVKEVLDASDAVIESKEQQDVVIRQLVNAVWDMERYGEFVAASDDLEQEYDEYRTLWDYLDGGFPDEEGTYQRIWGHVDKEGLEATYGSPEALAEEDFRKRVAGQFSLAVQEAERNGHYTDMDWCPEWLLPEEDEPYEDDARFQHTAHYGSSRDVNEFLRTVPEETVFGYVVQHADADEFESPLFNGIETKMRVLEFLDGLAERRGKFENDFTESFHEPPRFDGYGPFERVNIEAHRGGRGVMYKGETPHNQRYFQADLAKGRQQPEKAHEFRDGVEEHRGEPLVFRAYELEHLDADRLHGSHVRIEQRPPGPQKDDSDDDGGIRIKAAP